MKKSKVFLLIIMMCIFPLILSCGGGGDGGGGSSDGGRGITGIHNANGTYSYNSKTGILIVNFTSSDFVECGPEVSTQQFVVTEVAGFV